jgi:hypothetical protein
MEVKTMVKEEIIVHKGRKLKIIEVIEEGKSKEGANRGEGLQS